MGVNTFISDLFFNTDLEEAVIKENKQFVDFDREKMIDAAKVFLNCLEQLSVADLPTPEELVADYYERV